MNKIIGTGIGYLLLILIGFSCSGEEGVENFETTEINGKYYEVLECKIDNVSIRQEKHSLPNRKRMFFYFSPNGELMVNTDTKGEWLDVGSYVIHENKISMSGSKGDQQYDVEYTVTYNNGKIQLKGLKHAPEGHSDILEEYELVEFNSNNPEIEIHEMALSKVKLKGNWQLNEFVWGNESLVQVPYDMHWNKDYIIDNEEYYFAYYNIIDNNHLDISFNRVQLDDVNIQYFGEQLYVLNATYLIDGNSLTIEGISNSPDGEKDISMKLTKL